MHLIKFDDKYKEQVIDFFKKSIKDQNDLGNFAWDFDYYPLTYVEEDMKRRDMYLYFEGETLIGTVTLNRLFDSDYTSFSLQDNYLIVHRLCVDKKYWGKGIGTKIMQWSENFAKKEGYNSLVLDCNKDNISAHRLYTKLGYTEKGRVIYPSGEHITFEKIF